MSRLVLVVPRSRSYCGRCVLVGTDGRVSAGPLRVLATASDRVARRHGNPSCDPLFPFGHPPSGAYAVAGSLPPGYAHPRRPGRFGAAGALLLAPVSGAAAASLSNGRRVFALHGGPMDADQRLRPTRGGLRVSDADLTLLLRNINAANERGDPLEAIELLEVSDADAGAVPPDDLRGTRRAVGLPQGGRGVRQGAVPGELLMLLLGLGSAKGAAGDELGRREVLRAALLVVGGLSATACSSQPSPCTPLACDPGDGGPGDDGGPADAASDSATGASDGGAPRRDGGQGPDGGRGPRGRPRIPCPPRGFVCEQDYPGYIAGGGYVVGGGVG